MVKEDPYVEILRKKMAAIAGIKEIISFLEMRINLEESSDDEYFDEDDSSKS